MEFLHWLVRIAFWQNLIRTWPNLGPTRIPQFILDLKHEYVEENYSLINSLETPQEALCNQASLQREKLPPVPGDLFKHLFVDNSRAVMEYREGWKNAQGRLTEILECPAALETCEEFYLDIYRYDGGNYCGRPDWRGYRALEGQCPYEPEIPPEEIPQLLIKTLERMPNLVSLEWAAPFTEPAVSAFRKSFGESNLLLLSVRTLSLGPNLEFLIPLAKNVQSLRPSKIDGWNLYKHSSDRDSLTNSPEWRFLNATMGLEHLTELHLRTEWTIELIREVHKVQPNIHTLSMHGVINPSGIQGELYYQKISGLGNYSNMKEGQDLWDISPALASFGSLRNLTLPDVYSLDFDLPDLPMCGNTYFSSSGAKRGRFTALKVMSAAERAAKIVLSQLPHLETLCFHFNCMKNTDHGLSWPWTNRVREYLLDSWPRWERVPWGDLPDEDPSGPVFWKWEEDKRWLVDGELANLFDDEQNITEGEYWMI